MIAAFFSAQADYLSTLGPVPFQFQVVPKPVMATAKLLAAPAAKVNPEGLHPPQMPTESSEQPISVAELSVPMDESITVKSPEPYISTAALLFSSPPPEPPTEALTPQMLLQFFQSTGGESKRPEGLITGKVSFAPPRPDPKPPSTATLATH